MFVSFALAYYKFGRLDSLFLFDSVFYCRDYRGFHVATRVYNWCRLLVEPFSSSPVSVVFMPLCYCLRYEVYRRTTESIYPFYICFTIPVRSCSHLDSFVMEKSRFYWGYIVVFKNITRRYEVEENKVHESKASYSYTTLYEPIK